MGDGRVELRLGREGRTPKAGKKCCTLKVGEERRESEVEEGRRNLKVYDYRQSSRRSPHLKVIM